MNLDIVLRTDYSTADGHLRLIAAAKAELRARGAIAISVEEIDGVIRVSGDVDD